MINVEDLGHIKENAMANDTSYWYGTEYDPGLSVDDWASLLKDKSVFTPDSLEIMKRIKDFGGTATCTQLSAKYGKTANFYNSGSVAIAKRVCKAMEIEPNIREDGSTQWWTVLYTGRSADENEEGSFIWKLRDELREALDLADLSDVPLYSESSPSIWKISHGTNSTGINDANKIIFENRKVAVVHGTTGAMAGSKVSQGEAFMNGIKKGDYFYLCYGNSIRLFGQFISEKPILNPEMQNGWYEREYIVIAESKDTSPYAKTKKWWTPNSNSTCIKIGDDDKPLFEKLILKPYFDLTIDAILDKATNLPPSNAEFLKYFAPLIEALKELGGSASRNEAHEKVIELMDISEEELEEKYEKTGASRVLNQIDFARQYLVYEGIISNTVKGVWSLTELGMDIEMTPEFASDIFAKWVKINAAKRKGEPIPEINLSKYYQTKKKTVPKYTKEKFLQDVFITESEYEKLRSLVLRKKNVILQGAPGVGKTFSAKRLAYSIIGEENDNRICMVQFHQNYSYEDFIMGYRPNESGGFDLRSGVFYNFCERCKENPNEHYFFIIDEINRGNLSKIFGELLMLIETDKRGEKNRINLVYGGSFYIPDNLHIIGMMNTADRSLALIDYALRRRFSFYPMSPAFKNADKNGFGEYVNGIDCELYHTVIAKIEELNKAIRKDSSLGKDFEIGHSYFAPKKKEDVDEEFVRGVVEYEIIPLIEEYWFDNDTERRKWKEALCLTAGVDDDGR